MNLDWPAFGQLVWTQIWQVAAVVALVTALTRVPAVRRRPHLSYALWLLVLAKSLTPPLVASPTSAFSWTLAVRKEMAFAVPEDTSDVVAELPTVVAPLPVIPSEPIRFDTGALEPNAKSLPSEPQALSAIEERPPTPEPAVSQWSVVALLFVLWAIGAAGYVGISLVRLRRMIGQLATGRKDVPADLGGLLADLAAMFELRNPPRLIVTREPIGPALVGVLRPALVVPDVICHYFSREQLRLVLAHELVHLRRGDHWIGLMQFLAQAIWWFNPLIWWSNRELNRVREQCCDEQLVAGLRCEPAHYAQTLLDILRLRPRLQPVFFASGVRAMQVTEQRLEHIMSDGSRFQRATPRTYWLAAGFAALLVLPGAGLALEPTGPTESTQTKNKQRNDDGAASKKVSADDTSYTGRVVDSETKKPIEGAVVKLRKGKRGVTAKTAQTSEHRTNEGGEFRFSLPVSNESEYSLYHLYAEVEHPEYVRRAIGDYATSAGQPFFKQIEMYRSAELRGVVETPDGQPSKNTRVAVYSVLNPDDLWRSMELPSNTTTDDQGRFRVAASRDGVAALWVVPDDFAPKALDLGEKRGDLGTLRLEKGLHLAGQVVDSADGPVSGVRVWADLKDRVLSQIAPPQGGNEARRTTVVDKDGRFRFDPLPAGNYRVWVVKNGPREYTEAGLAPIFSTYTVKLSEDDQAVELRAVAHVTVEARCLDSAGHPVANDTVQLSGQDAQRNGYQTSAVADENGTMLMLAPKGLTRTSLSTFTNAPGCIVRFRPFGDAKIGPRRGFGDELDLGTLAEDVKGIEVVRYRCPTLIVKAVDQSNRLIANFKPAIRYASTPAGSSNWIARGWRTDVRFTRLSDGRWQSERLAPNEEFAVSATASGPQTASQKLKLSEGEVKEMTLTLVTKDDAKKAGPQGGKGDQPKKETHKDDRNRDTSKQDAAKSAAEKERRDARKEAFYNHSLTVFGKALDEGGSPIDGATVYLVSTNVSKEQLLGQTKTDKDGRYDFRDKQLPIWVPEDSESFEQGSFEVFGQAPGRAFAWQGMKHLHLGPRPPGVVIAGKGNYIPGQKIELDLIFSQPKTIQGRIVDETGKPISGVRVQLQNCDYLDRSRLENDNATEFWAIYQAVDAMPDLLGSESDSDGRFTFRSVPPDVVCRLYIEHPKFAHFSIYASTADRAPGTYDGGHPLHISPLNIELREVKTIPVTVVAENSGRPVPGIQVTGYQRRATGTSDHGMTDSAGKVTLKLPPGEYKLVSDPPRTGSAFVRTYQDLIVAEKTPVQPAEFKMNEGCRLVLKAVDAETGAGIPGVTFWYEREPGSRWSVQSSTSYVDNPKTNEKGELRAIVLPGKTHYGVGFGPPPDGYRAVQPVDMSRGRELDLRAGETVTAEFKLQKPAASVKESNEKPAEKADDKESSEKSAKASNNSEKKPLDEQQLEYAKVKTLTDAMAILKRRLEKVGVSEYTPLITEDTVKRAIRTSINHFRAMYAQEIGNAKDAKAREALQRDARHFMTVIKPLLDQIVDKGTWPPATYFDHGPNPESPFGFSLNLHLDTRDIDDYEISPGSKSIGYAVQIINIQYGTPGPNDSVLRILK